MAAARNLARDFRPSEAAVAADANRLAEGVARVRPESSGTGFFITEDGYLITNQRLAESGRHVEAITEAGIMPARVVKVDVADDLALLKVDGTFTALPVLSSQAVKAGGTVAVVGFPSVGLQGFAPKLAKGRVAALAKGQDNLRCFEVDVPVQPGNSGGPLVDQYGNVVGVLSQRLNETAVLETTGALADNVNFALKSSQLLGFLESRPDVSAKLNQPNFNERRFEDVVESTGKATALVVVH